jgi:hypothetical protein
LKETERGLKWVTSESSRTKRKGKEEELLKVVTREG